MRKSFKVLMIMAIVIVTVACMSAVSFAANPGHANVSITQNNFNTSGQYVGGGTPATVDGVTITDVSVNIASLQAAITYSNFKHNNYLPAGVADPMNGAPSILDAVCRACRVNNINSMVTGWDSYNSPNGAYVSNLGGYDVTNTVTYFKGANNNKWAKSEGSGWQIAYKLSGTSSYTTANVYYSNVALPDGVDIIIDYSPYEMTWDTGEAW